MSELTLRFLSSIFLILAGVCLFLGSNILFILIVQLFYLLTLWEYFRLIKFFSFNPSVSSKYSNFFLSRTKIDYKNFIIIFIFLISNLVFYFNLFYVSALLFFVGFFLFLKQNGNNPFFLIGLIYISLPFLLLIFLKTLTIFEVCISFIILFSLFVDTSAFFIGKKFGGKKLAPSVSPNKTISGFIGGILTPCIVSLLLFYNNNNFFEILIFSILFSVTVQSGDLIQSKFKRYCGVKDCSNIIPGHGGMLDRLDGIFLFLILISLFVILDYNLFFIM